MLLTMHIKNIALIEEIDISFEDKLNIMTGETGAGKSIIIGSLGLCLGGKYSKELLRDEEKEGLVELTFLVSGQAVKEALQKLDVEMEDDELVISRRLQPNGRTINRVNDVTVTVNRLKEIASLLINLHAQHEQQTLLKASKHLEILDRFGGETISRIKEQVKHDYSAYKELTTQKEQNSMDEAEKNKRMDFLQYEINEITSAHLVDGEDEELEHQYKKAVNAKEILEEAGHIYQMTGLGNMSASEQVRHAVLSIRRLTELDLDLQGMADVLQDVDGLLDDFNREFSDYMKNMEFDEETFREMEDRLNLINSLKAKYGQKIPDILHSLALFEEEYEKLTAYDAWMQELDKKCETAKNTLLKSSGRLTDARKKCAASLCRTITDSLRDLNFNMVEFEMRFQALDTFSANGMDEAVFYISTNVGEDLKPLYEVASGGELSRIMLAIKACLADQDDTQTLVFDEIDVGISGRTAQKVAEKMSVLGRNHQVICITHLPQIAAMADAHYLIEKNVENQKTISNIRKLSEEEEIGELAKMIGGAEITDAIIHTATEMKGLAEQAKIY